MYWKVETSKASTSKRWS